MLKKFDFLVNGGGLVGCLTSLVLSKKNYSVCLIEKNNFKNTISDSYLPLSLTISSVEFLKQNKAWDSEIIKSNEIKNLLISQIEGRVRWLETIELMIDKGTNNFIEIGPGKVLSGLIKRINKNININSINNLDDMNKINLNV